MILALFDVVPRLTLKVPGRTAERTHHHIPRNSDLVLNKRQWTTSLQRGHSSASSLLHLPQAQQVIPSPRHHASLDPLPLLPPRRHHPSSTITKSHLFTLGDTETRKPLTIPKWELHCRVLTLAPHRRGVTPASRTVWTAATPRPAPTPSANFHAASTAISTFPMDTTTRRRTWVGTPFTMSLRICECGLTHCLARRLCPQPGGHVGLLQPGWILEGRRRLRRVLDS